MSKKIILVTGSSSGFGHGIVTRLIAEGHTVIATMRNAEKRKHLFDGLKDEFDKRLFIVSLDVANKSECDSIKEIIATRHGAKLDCLINNAGYGLFGALEDLDDDAIDYQMNINFLSLVKLTKNMLPFLRAAKGRIINVSSLVGYFGFPIGSIYSASKHAVEGFSESLRHELSPHGVAVSLVEPGAFKTSFRENAETSKPSTSARSVYSIESNAYEKISTRALEKAPKHDEVVDAMALLVLCKKPPLRVRCGKDAKMAYALRRILPEELVISIVSYFYKRMVAKERKKLGQMQLSDGSVRCRLKIK